MLKFSLKTITVWWRWGGGGEYDGGGGGGGEVCGGRGTVSADRVIQALLLGKGRWLCCCAGAASQHPSLVRFRVFCFFSRRFVSSCSLLTPAGCWSFTLGLLLCFVEQSVDKTMKLKLH